MTTAIVSQPSPTRLRPPAVVKPARRPATAHGPQARPARQAPIPPRGLATTSFAEGSRRVVPPFSNGPVRACRTGKPSAPWRLTDRGIALVLVLTATIVIAAVTVIGLTAWRVTGPGYQATGVAQLSQR